LSTAETICCDFCGSKEFSVIYEAGVSQVAQIVECSNCGLMYANPRGSLDDAANYQRFEADGLLDGVETEYTHTYRWRFDKESLQVRDFDNSWEKLKPVISQGGHVVEVGSGMGFLLKKFVDAGWTATAIDPWPELTSFTERYHGFPTISDTLEGAKLEPESADLLIILHVIEHVPNPSETLAEIMRILKPGGHLVLETPRYDTLTYKLLGRRERSLRMDGHIYFYTDETLSQTIEKANFKIKDLEHVGRSMTAERFIWNAANLARSKKFTSTCMDLARKSGLAELKFRINLADMVRVIAQKPLTQDS